jgi:predicted RNase H-like HicB family nuclease
MGEVNMLTAYINAAMRKARYAILPDGEGYFGNIAELQGVWANADSLEACREELQEALEEWIVLGLQMGHLLPEIDGISLNVDDEHKDWLRLSQSTLEKAYSSDEPTYSLDAIKEPNPDYESS